MARSVHLTNVMSDQVRVTRSSKILSVFCLFSSILLWGVNGCDSVDTAIDCNKICNRYKDCFDAAYDTGACVDRCKTNADDRDYSDKVNGCEACIDDRSCSDATFKCATQCVSVVP